jgi:hypothetical protein
MNKCDIDVLETYSTISVGGNLSRVRFVFSLFGGEFSASVDRFIFDKATYSRTEIEYMILQCTIHNRLGLRISGRCSFCMSHNHPIYKCSEVKLILEMGGMDKTIRILETIIRNEMEESKCETLTPRSELPDFSPNL